jgi:hypothetical protein
MLNIFKWFFGVIGIIILIYVLIVMVRTVLKTGYNTATDPTVDNVVASNTQKLASSTINFSLSNWLANFHPFNYSPVDVALPNGQPSVVDQIYNNSSTFHPDGYSNEASEMYFQSLNEAPADHPTDYAPVTNSIMNSYSKSESIDSRYGIRDSNQATEETAPSNQFIFSSIHPGATVKSYQDVTGMALDRVFWNGVFPIFVYDGQGNKIGFARAYPNGDLQPNGYVRFRGVLQYQTPRTANGYLVFQNESQEISGINAKTIVPVNFGDFVQVRYYNYPQRHFPNMLFPSPRY